MRSPQEFRRVFSRGRRFDGKYGTVYFLATDLPQTRIGLSVSRKVGGAVHRNRVKRLYREALRNAIEGMPRTDASPLAYDVVCVGKKAGVEARMQDIRGELLEFIKKMKRIKQ